MDVLPNYDALPRPKGADKRYNLIMVGRALRVDEGADSTIVILTIILP
jgi:hypothetical protein